MLITTICKLSKLFTHLSRFCRTNKVLNIATRIYKMPILCIILITSCPQMVSSSAVNLKSAVKYIVGSYIAYVSIYCIFKELDRTIRTLS